MHLTRLSITNFRDIASLELTDLSKSVAIFGLNGQGKSSALHALRMLLFGWCSLTSKNGAGSDALIRDGEAESVIKAQFDGHLTASLSLFASGKKKTEFSVIDDDTGVIIANSREDFWKLVDVPQDLAMVTAFPDTFIKSKDLGDILADFLVSEIKEQDILGYARSRADWLKEFAKKNRVKLTDLETLGAKAEEVRKENNRDLKRSKDTIEQQGFVTQPVSKAGKPLTRDDGPQLEDAIKTLKHQRDELLKAFGACSQTRSSTEVAAELSAAMDDNFKANKDVAGLDAPILAFDADINSQQSALASSTQQSNDTMNMIDRLKRALAGCSKGDTCPTCQRPFTANGKSLLETLIAEWQQKQETINAERDSMLKKLAELRVNHKEAKDQRDALTAKIYKLQERINSLKAEQSAVPASGVTEDQIGALTSRIENGERILAELQIYTDRILAEEHIQILESEINNLDWAVIEFRDGAAMKHFAGSKVETFTDRCNIELEPFGYSMSVSISGKNVEILLAKNGNHFRPVTHCSAGEQTLAAWAMALAFADTGALVLLDDINQLDYVNRRHMLERLERDSIGTTIVAGAVQSNGEANDYPFSVFMEDGSLVAV